MVLSTVTTEVVMVNVPVLEPAGTVTVAGIVVEGLASETWTTNPPVGARVLIPTVPVTFVPPSTDVGAIEKLVRAGLGTSCRFADLLTVPSVAVTGMFLITVTAEGVMVNVPVLEPSGTVTVAGIVVEGLLSET